MPNIFINDDNQSLSPKDSKTFDNLIEGIADKVFYNNPENSAGFAIAMSIRSTPEIDQQIAKHGFAKVRLDFIKTAFEKPHQLQGFIAIFADDKKVFHVEDREVIKDSLNLISNRWIDNIIGESFDTAKRAIEGIKLLQYMDSILKILGQKNEQGDLHYESKNYLFNHKSGQITVTAKAGHKEILNNDGFTKLATDSDMTALQKFKDIVEELKLDDDPQTERPSLKL